MDLCFSQCCMAWKNNDKRMWIRAVWKETEEEEGVIPASWMNENVVFWPPGSNADKAMRKGEKPTEKWSRFRLIKIKLKSESKAECDRHDDTTTIETSDDDEDTDAMVKRKQKEKQFHDFLTDGVTEKDQADSDISECRNEPARTGMVNLPVPPVKFAKQSQPRSRSPLIKKNECLKDNSESSSRLPLVMSQQSSGRPPVTQSKKSTSQPLVTQITSISSRPQLAMLQQSSGRPPVTQSKKSTSQPLVTQTTSVASKPQLAMSQRSNGRPPVTQSKKSTPHTLVTQTTSESSRPQLAMSKQSSSTPSVTQSKKSTSHTLQTQTTLVSSRPQLAMLKQSSGTPLATQSLKSTSHTLVTKPSKTNNSRSRQSISPQRSYRSRSLKSSRSRSRRSSHSRSPRSSRSRSRRSSWSRSRSRQSARFRSERWFSSRSQRLSRSRSRSGSQLRTSFAANETPTRKDAFPMTEARFQRRVLFVLADMRQQLSSFSRDHLATAQGDTGEVVPEKAGNLQEFVEMEEMLKNPEKRRIVIERLSSVGGLNLKDNVRKIMDRFMTNDVMAGFNMKGNTGKMSFQKTAVFKVVQASVMKTFGTATEHEVDGAIGSCLKYAPDRRGGGGRKK